MWARRIVSYVLTALAVVIWVLLLFPDRMNELSTVVAYELLFHEVGLWSLFLGATASLWVWMFSFGDKAMKYSQASFVGLVVSIKLLLGFYNDISSYDIELDTSLHYVMSFLSPILLFATAAQVIEVRADSR